ncbi:uncharacterized protein K02A2.6-like [Achroia grisella]|uniref:uncharacterized protein K02A2.6-like n=1 Tax=Achroia grisella TaxID=688607 RepID=UPI0027D262B6|nr:uncharacterized protein K02A2.6-like [Achroia grisella]
MASNILFKSFQEGDDINCFLERMEQHFTANDIDKVKQLPTLLISLHQDVYKILKSMVHPSLPKEKSYKEIEEALKLRFQPRVSHFRKRIRFYSLRQAEGESASKWFTRVKEAATECNFEKNIEENVKDKFVTGLRPGPIQDRLCEETITRNIKELLDIALNKESAYQENKELVIVNKISSKSNKKQDCSQVYNKQKSDRKAQDILKCIHCGKPNHSFAKCKYKTYKCKICNKIGHLAIVCKNKPTNSIDIREEQVDMFMMVPITDVNHISPFMVKCYVNSIPLNMELDTGAAVSCITKRIYSEKFSNVKLEGTPLVLKTYSGEIVKPVGKISVALQVNERKCNCSLLVVENGCRNLFGRDLMNILNINLKELTDLNSIDSLNLENILQEYSDVFKNELGVIKGEKIHLELKENTEPIFMKPRPIPFSFKDKVEHELTKLENEGVITKVDNSDWGTSLVPVIKENGQLRLCANYKVTVNKYLKDVNHPIPRIEEIFTALQGGQNYSRLDLRNAFNHLILDEATGKLLAWSTSKGIYKLNRLPYGTKPASAIFQSKLEKILLGAKGVVNFIDDVVVTGVNDLEHLQNLREVLKRFKDAGIRLNKNKCIFFQKEIRNKPLRLACDASNNGIGAVLSHIMSDGSERPITFISRVYTKAERGYSMIHKEALA